MPKKNTYELTYIVNSVYSEEQIKDIVTRVGAYIKDHGGNVVEVDEWGARRLAYPIEKKRNGYYVNLVFEAPGDMIAKFERAMEINDGILRYLTLRLDGKMLRQRSKHKAKLAAEESAAAEEAKVAAEAKTEEAASES